MFNTNGARRAALGAASAALLALSLTACGEKESSSEPGAGPTVTAAADSALAAKVPDAIKADGVIKVGTDSTYAPAEFLDADGKTVIGFDVELFNAVAQKLGLKAEYQSSPFDAILPGVDSGKYEIGVSSFTINAERLKSVNMVSYFSAGTQWATKAGNPAKIDIENACGKKIAVQTATVQFDDITARSKKCTDRRQAGDHHRPVPGAERRHGRRGQRQGRRHAGRLAGRRVRGEAEQRPAGAGRRHLRVRPVRLRRQEGPDRLRRGAQGGRPGGHRRRHVQDAR